MEYLKTGSGEGVRADQPLDRTQLGVSKLKRGLHRLSESTHVIMPRCWKSRVAAQLELCKGCAH